MSYPQKSDRVPWYLPPLRAVGIVASTLAIAVVVGYIAAWLGAPLWARPLISTLPAFWWFIWLRERDKKRSVGR
jgi:hypothetical protein